jgi:2-amino-4-hydroxy-6-hydroxymethyldihydropteridine diphosphokinase
VILIGLGSNLSGPWGNPRETVLQAITVLDRWPLRVLAVSSLIDTDPFGKPNQPRYVNAVAAIKTSMPPEALMHRLLDVEKAGGRKRLTRWGPRTIDLDLLVYNERLLRHTTPKGKALALPHPGLSERTFVVAPILEICPKWRHPVSRKTAGELLNRL